MSRIERLERRNHLNEIQRPLEVIETEINFYKEQTATGIIEIGKRLIEAKKQVSYGGWGIWLKEKVEFSQRTANQFMKVASEFPDSKALANLGQTKVFALLDVPQEERQDFIDSNPVDEMTTRELQKAIREKNQADAKIKELETQLQQKPKEVEVVQEVKVVPDDYYQLQEDLETARFEKEQLARRLKEETDPDRFQRLAQSESDARVEVRRLEKQIEAMEADSKTIEHKVRKSSITFCGKVHNFLTDVGGLAWINDYHDLLDGQERKDYMTALNAIEGWLYAIKNNIEGE